MSTQTDILKHIPIDPHTGAIAVPIYQTTTFAQEAPGVNKGFDYTRTNNPTRQALEELVASLENGAKGFAFGSGLAAIDAVFKTLSQGDEVIAVANIYGGTYRLLNEVYAKFGIKTHYVDTTIVENVEKAITNNTKLIWIESPTNPTLKLSDIQAIADIAKKHKVWLCVDNTFATPIAQKPLDLGADLVVHSATKYIAGHSDVVAGLVITKTEELGKIIKFHQNSTGAILSPFDSFLTIRGIETLLLRYKGYSENALKIAEYLSTHPKINKIYYPGLVNHEGHELAKKQQKYFGGVISFDLKDNSKEAALKIIQSLKLFTLTEGLGGIKSLSNYPFEMSHGSVPKETKIEAGITESLIRLSIGLEETEDLIEDIKQALAQ
ncbi:PLP-dependent transferase [Myroides marinus]|uniref:trans-sulfuration enzyme family protein n=1 Tax=Myroides marinus TaxID=703342 RepID=UPI002577999C|nr:PLP-dependent aspartate aminotransferase family protein [Myroides marinus]MDM1347065.1 PLP-dependent transferase [Myroides marinus]MDM1350584.1 PLP-dependent transferase [Myroides marinus]MDM1354304.1 PLP-dependent transferase [Myroides marinus]MDM1357791.1 PLP-dependent transferase [Myroides marinus]MDM1362479.1 PLP-dependent transferase [Myroides marinus]